MSIKNNTNKVLTIFLEDSLGEFRLREIGRKTKLSPTAVKKHLEILEKEKLINKIIKMGNPIYIANRDTERFSLNQRTHTIFTLEDSGLLEFLSEKAAPTSITLFGSHVKGEATKDSDIDLFLIGKETDIEVSDYEKKLNKKLHIFFQEDPKIISKELKNNLINGIVLRGYLKLL